MTNHETDQIIQASLKLAERTSILLKESDRQTVDPEVLVSIQKGLLSVGQQLILNAKSIRRESPEQLVSRCKNDLILADDIHQACSIGWVAAANLMPEEPAKRYFPVDHSGAEIGVTIPFSRALIEHEDVTGTAIRFIASFTSEDTSDAVIIAGATLHNAKIAGSPPCNSAMEDIDYAASLIDNDTCAPNYKHYAKIGIVMDAVHLGVLPLASSSDLAKAIKEPFIPSSFEQINYLYGKARAATKHASNERHANAGSHETPNNTQQQTSTYTGLGR